MIRMIALALGLLAAVPALAFDIGNMTAQERAAFREAVRAYLLDNPEVIFEAVEVHEARQAALQAQNDVEMIRTNASLIFDDGVSWVGGNPEGDITIVEFLDYRCGYCRKAFDDVHALVTGDGNIRFIIKEFPILGEESTLASRFAIAVRNTAGPDAYKDIHDRLMTLRGSVGIASLTTVAQNAGLDMDAIRKAMDSSAVDAEINANYQLGRKLGINGTPSFVFQSEMLRGYAPLDAMQAIVARVRG